jgi:hypothetical protein
MKGPQRGGRRECQASFRPVNSAVAERCIILERCRTGGGLHGNSPTMKGRPVAEEYRRCSTRRPAG